MSTMTVRGEGIAETAATLRAMPEQIAKAQRRAIDRTVRHVASETRKGLAAVTGAKASAIKPRITGRMLRQEGLVWIGLNPLLPIHLADTVRQDSGGVTAGDRQYPGAFFESVYGGQKKVWIRLKSKHYDPETYPYKKRASGPIAPELRHRFPVVLARVPVDTDAVRALIGKEADNAGPYLQDLVESELRYVVTGSRSAA